MWGSNFFYQVDEAVLARASYLSEEIKEEIPTSDVESSVGVSDLTLVKQIHLSLGPILNALIRMESITSEYAKSIMERDEFKDIT